MKSNKDDDMSTLEEALRLLSLFCWMGVIGCLFSLWVLRARGIIVASILLAVSVASYFLAERISRKDEETKERIKERINE